MLIPRQPLHRRHLLRGCGAAVIALPFLEAMGPSLGRQVLGAETDDASPKRFVAMCATLGFHGPHLFPQGDDPDLQWTPYLLKLADNRDQLTLFSGLSHPEQQGNNGHASELTWLTSAQRPGLAGFRNSVSLDQLIAEQIGIATRYPYLALSTSGRSMSWSSNGVEIPGMTSPSKLFTALFIDGNEKRSRRGNARTQDGVAASSTPSELGPRNSSKVSVMRISKSWTSTSLQFAISSDDCNNPKIGFGDPNREWTRRRPRTSPTRMMPSPSNVCSTT